MKLIYTELAEQVDSDVKEQHLIYYLHHGYADSIVLKITLSNCKAQNSNLIYDVSEYYMKSYNNFYLEDTKTYLMISNLQ